MTTEYRVEYFYTQNVAEDTRRYYVESFRTDCSVFEDYPARSSECSMLVVSSGEYDNIFKNLEARYSKTLKSLAEGEGDE